MSFTTNIACGVPPNKFTCAQMITNEATLIQEWQWMPGGFTLKTKNIETKHKMPDTHVRTPKWWGITSHWVWFANQKLDNKKRIIARIFLLRNKHKRPRGQPGWLCLLITHFSQKARQPPMLTGMEGMGVSSLVGGAHETKHVSSSQFAIKEALGPMDANPPRFNLEANLVFSTKYMYAYNWMSCVETGKYRCG